MDGENVKVRDRVELALDGRQIASIVVGALVLLGVVFVLGLNVGKQAAVKQLEASRADGLAALDQPPPVPAVAAESLTYHDTLTGDRKGPPEPTPQVKPVEPKPVEARPAEAKVEPKPAPPEARPARQEGTKGAYVVQVVATPSRAEADRLLAKLKDYTPRVEEAEVPGKGRMYRVRVGSFGTKPEAEKFLKAFNGKTGSKGLVVAAR